MKYTNLVLNKKQKGARNFMENFFKLKENNTTFGTELLAGLTTFFAMSYIIFVNPSILSQTGMPFQAVFLSTIIASVVSTLVMGLFANVPYALAPGMGLNAFFTFTVVFGLGFSWQEALAMVFICGLLNIFITVTKIRKMIIQAIPVSMQHAIGGGIGVFVAYIGLKNANLLSFLTDAKTITTINNQPFQAPSLVNFTQSDALLALIGLFITVILVIKNVRGAILIGIIATTLLAIPMGVVDLSTVNWSQNSLASAFSDLQVTLFAAFGPDGMGKLFSNPAKLPLVLMTIFAFSLSDTFDTLGTFIGTGRKTGIFSAEDERMLEEGSGFSSKMDKALFADAIGTSIGAVFGTSNTTTYVESAAGIGAGGRTGLTAVTTAALLAASALLAPFVGIVPAAATAPALIIVGVMMLSSFADVQWDHLDEAVPAFFAGIFMALCYSISYGIAAGFIFYCFIKTLTGKSKEIHPILWVATGLFILNFIILAII